MPNDRNQNQNQQGQQGQQGRTSQNKSELGERLREGDSEAASELGHEGGRKSHQND